MFINELGRDPMNERAMLTEYCRRLQAALTALAGVMRGSDCSRALKLRSALLEFDAKVFHILFDPDDSAGSSDETAAVTAQVSLPMGVAPHATAARGETAA